ncbi:hypothetical protein HMPREF3213_02130 [Heyndrickxia coagulans]|uniref:Uncharacterized protein n=1 Tax=Heyndrickxia coagulans TaxID=1398 RepID=A0A133KNE8_HEYCO|nr:hypothetical protein HMPREF3213_02130 [Heyndrickxia coagulans]
MHFINPVVGLPLNGTLTSNEVVVLLNGCSYDIRKNRSASVSCTSSNIPVSSFSVQIDHVF